MASGDRLPAKKNAPVQKMRLFLDQCCSKTVFCKTAASELASAVGFVSQSVRKKLLGKN
jgi:hypothetical protein